MGVLRELRDLSLIQQNQTNMPTPPAPSADLTVPEVAPRDPTKLWPEPLDTPGYIPRHMKQSATAAFPILEVIQRLLYRLKPSGGDLEKILALIGLYQAVRPVYNHLKDICIWAFTVQVTIPENDAVAKEVLAWMGSEVILKSRSRSVMLVTGGMQDPNDDFHRRMMVPRGPGKGPDRVNDEVLCLPPIGTRLFWYVSSIPRVLASTAPQVPLNTHILTSPGSAFAHSFSHAVAVTAIGTIASCPVISLMIAVSYRTPSP